MIYIVCFIHVFYWLGMGEEPIQSLALFEMSIIFFISGASLSVSNRNRGILATIWNRFKRVLVPYYVYVIVLLSLGVGWLLLKTFFNEQKVIWFYSLTYIREIILFENIPRFDFVRHLWFIPPYMILSSTFSLQVALMKRIQSWQYLLGCVILFLLTLWFKRVGIIRIVFCYNIFMVAGYLYYRKLSVSHIATIGSLTFLALLFFSRGEEFAPMQNHKFPPDMIFVLYNIVVLCVLSLLFGKIRLPNCRLFQIWNERGYTIYLYQSLVYTFIYKLHTFTSHHISFHFALLIIDIAMIFIVSTLLSYMTYPIEHVVVRTLGKYGKQR